MPGRKDWTGQRFGRLVAVSFVGRKHITTPFGFLGAIVFCTDFSMVSVIPVPATSQYRHPHEREWGGLGEQHSKLMWFRARGSACPLYLL